MPYYWCTVADSKGKKTRLLTRAGNQAELLEAYAAPDVFLLSFVEAASPGNRRDGAPRRSRFSAEQVREFTGMMAALLKAGNTVNAALELCRSLGAERALDRMCTALLEGIRRGERFAEALVRCAPSFSPLYRAMVGIGEKTGRTAEVFERLTAYLKTSQRIRNKVGGALVYPVLVLAAAAAGSALILVFVMPRMAELFAVFNAGGAQGVDVSGMYATVYGTAAFFGFLAVATVLVLVLRGRSERAALALDGLALKLPFVGAFCTALESLDFFFALELCSSAGMNAAGSLEEAQAVLRNRFYARAVMKVRAEVQGGAQLSEAFFKPPFPPVICRWIAVGEETGEAGAVFGHLKQFFEETVETATEKFLNGLEPVVILLTGLVVLALVVQFVLPLFGLYGAAL
jgi:type II secretory pathway component PulF